MKKVKTLFMMLTLFFTFAITANAESNAIIEFDEIENVEVETTFTEYVRLRNITGANINAISGSISTDNDSCIKLKEVKA